MKNKVPTLKEAAFITYKRRKNGDISAKDFLNSMNHNVEALGNIPVNKITTSMISKMNDYNKARPNCNEVVNKKMGHLKLVLEDCRDDGHLTMPEFPKPLRVKKNKKVHYLTDDMEIELLDKVTELGHHEHRDVFKCLIDLGCRVMELLTLEKRFIDFEKNQITFQYRKNGRPNTVPMSNKVRDIIKPYYDKCNTLDYVFDHNYYWAESVFKKVKRELGYEKKKWYKIHLFRDTAGSRLVQRGVHLLIVRDWLGHEDVKMTEKYSHLAPNSMHSVVEVLN